MAYILMNGAMFLILLICGVQDLLKRKILLWYLLIGTALIGICIPFCEDYAIWNRVGGILIGVTVILISIATSGKIGLGDGLILCVTGLGLGFWDNLELFAFALLFASIFSIFLLVFHLADRKKSIPFVPFLFLGYLVIFFANRQG